MDSIATEVNKYPYTIKKKLQVRQRTKALTIIC